MLAICHDKIYLTEECHACSRVCLLYLDINMSVCIRVLFRSNMSIIYLMVNI